MSSFPALEIRKQKEVSRQFKPFLGQRARRKNNLQDATDQVPDLSVPSEKQQLPDKQTKESTIYADQSEDAAASL